MSILLPRIVSDRWPKRHFLPQEVRMKTVAYVRVSTDTQDMTHQRLAILEFARTERMVVDEVLEIQASAQRSLTVRRIDVLLSRLEPGDTLIVSELSRL